MPDISRRKGFPPSVKASSWSWASAHDHAVPQGSWAALGTCLPSFCALLTAITALTLHIRDSECCREYVTFWYHSNTTEYFKKQEEGLLTTFSSRFSLCMKSSRRVLYTKTGDVKLSNIFLLEDV